MPQNIAKSAVERTSKRLLDEVFVSLGKLKRRAVEAIFDSILRVGSSLEKDIALSVPNVTTSRKGLQEKVSGWLLRYDFAAPVHDYLWREGARMIGLDTVIAVDSGDISKEFGGKGMEGMEMGYDASRGVTAMGHSLLCAAIVLRRRATGTNGYNVRTGEYCDLIKAGVFDPAKVVRSALQNAASIAGLLLTTDYMSRTSPKRRMPAAVADMAAHRTWVA